MWEKLWYLAEAYYNLCDLTVEAVVDAIINRLEAVTNKYLFPPTAAVDSLAQQTEISDPSGNEDKKRERSEHGTERRQDEIIERQKEIIERQKELIELGIPLIERQKELIELRIPLQPSAVRSRTPMEETSPVIPNSQNDCQPQVRLPIYSQIKASIPTVGGEIDAPSIVADTDGNPAANPDQRNSDSIDGNFEVGEYDEKLKESNDGDPGEADLQYQDDGLSGAVGTEQRNPNDKPIPISTSPVPQSLQGGNRTPIIVRSSPRWRQPGRC